MRAMGIDYGQRRIGLALSDASGMLARPWKALDRIGNPSQVAQALVAELDALETGGEMVGVLVLGYPRRLGGEPTNQTMSVLGVADRLRALIRIPVVLQDERLSSHEAESLLARREKDWRKRKALLDAMSAAVILQDYLDGAAGRAVVGPEGEDT
jgi:putative Holliday junction resolvase